MFPEPVQVEMWKDSAGCLHSSRVAALRSDARHVVERSMGGSCGAEGEFRVSVWLDKLQANRELNGLVRNAIAQLLV